MARSVCGYWNRPLKGHYLKKQQAKAVTDRFGPLISDFANC